MAFKNLLKADVATGGDFTRSANAFAPSSTGELWTKSFDTSRHFQGAGSTKVRYDNPTPGSLAIYPSPYSVLGGLNYSLAILACCDLVNAPLKIRIAWRNSSGTTISVDWGNPINASGNFQTFTISTISPLNATSAYLIIGSDSMRQGYSIWWDFAQFEQNSTATSWEFPGIDLTGNSIPANTNVNNLKLENIIRAFGIESQEHVNNLTLQNILTLTGIPSEEYVNNIQLLNEIILEAIESTTSVKDLIIYIKCNYLNLRFEMKYPSTSFKMKQPHTTFKMKYP